MNDLLITSSIIGRARPDPGGVPPVLDGAVQGEDCVRGDAAAAGGGAQGEQGPQQRDQGHHGPGARFTHVLTFYFMMNRFEDHFYACQGGRIGELGLETNYDLQMIRRLVI